MSDVDKPSCPARQEHSASDRGMSRREFLSLSVGAAILPMVGENVWAETRKGEIPYRTMGRTGEKISLIGIGGAHLGSPGEQMAIRIVRTAIDNGINFMDNCWDYHGGASEERMGKALRDGYRQRVFLMTKIDGRDANTAVQQINESLRRLQTDHIDLMQIHEVIRTNDPGRVFAPGGAMEAILAAKKAGKVRYIGFTGHKDPQIHLQMLDAAEKHKFTFDAVQLPLNVMDAHFDSFEKLVLPKLTSQRIGVLGMKPMGGKIILQSKAVTPVQCLHYAMNLPTSVVITGCDSLPVLQQALSAAREFQPMSKERVAALLQKTATLARNGEYEKYKTSRVFDGTHHHPEWLGPSGEQAPS